MKNLAIFGGLLARGRPRRGRSPLQRGMTPAMTHEGRSGPGDGCRQGIGQAIALALAARGARVISTDLVLPQETVSKIGRGAFGLQLDVSQEDAWRRASLQSQDVVKSTSWLTTPLLPESPGRRARPVDMAQTMATNLDAHFLSAKFFLPAMRRRKWGRFVGSRRTWSAWPSRA